ncbi:hypothetical protein BKA93DRAFT_569950 [Sparassis latifolia]
MAAHPQGRSFAQSKYQSSTVIDSLSQRVADAAVSIMGVAGDVVHEALLLSSDVVQFSPIPGLQVAARGLLDIWDALQLVDMNRLACLRLTERCATILLSVREEIAEAGDEVGQELFSPITRLVGTYSQIHGFMLKQNHRPFIKRYLKRGEVQQSIQECEQGLNDALSMFSLAIQVRILKQVLHAEEQRQADTAALLDHVMHSSPLEKDLPALPITSSNLLQFSSTVADSASSIESRNSDEVRATLQELAERQNEQDLVQDTADMRQLMRAALQANSDVEMIRVLQVGRDEMPEAIKVLQRALETEVERESIVSEHDYEDAVSAAIAADITTGPVESHTRMDASVQSRKSSGGGSSLSWKSTPRDTLDREFIETGIDALRRLSGAEVSLPSWTITRYEVDREEKIGIGFFSDVYKGTWRNRTVAIKVLAQTTPRQMFVHEVSLLPFSSSASFDGLQVSIWKTLQHPNVLELLGASSTSCDPPWFFVSPYYKNGSMVEYLRGVPTLDSVDLLKMIHETAKGMSYLHGRGVLHSDLKGANILVNDRGHCVISDFGQSEMKSEVYRISGTPLPHGTLRWQAPELMAGQSNMTQQMDVYAFAICCVEVLTKGNLPWPTADDDAVRYFVLEQNMRPELPLVRVWSSQLGNVIQSCWNVNPTLRPSFSKIEHDIKQIRLHFGADLRESPLPLKSPELATRKSPDMHPVPLPLLPPDTIIEESTISSDAASVQSAPAELVTTALRRPEPVQLSRQGSRTSSVHSMLDSLSEDGVILDRVDSPPPLDELRAEVRDERRYRMLLQHEFHPSLTLPLWTPTVVALGAVGYHSKPSGEFITLFNSFRPAESSGGVARDIPSLYGYGRVATGSQRQDKRKVGQRAMDLIQSWVPSRGTGPPNVSRRYSSPLRAGHKAAHLFTELTMYRYVEELATPKQWFKANIDHILDLYGAVHQITREDLYLVIGTLEAQDYALFVSHSHPDGQVNFSVYAAPRAGQPWGAFSTADAYHPTHGMSGSQVGGAAGPVYDEPVGSMLSASKVSNAGRAERADGWPVVLVARLRFKPDGSEPTSL